LRWQSVLKLFVILIMTVMMTACVSHELEAGLSEQDAQEIVVVLHDHGIPASAAKAIGEKKGEDKWSVVVRGGDQKLAEAWKVLRENGLPRQKDKGLDDVFSNAGMIPTATEEKARLLSGISGEISRTLKTIAGVIDARTLVVLPEMSPLLDKNERVPPTASVLIKYRGNAPPLPEQDVKNLVARSVEGLQPENVAVVYQRVEPTQPAKTMLIPYLGNQEFLLIALALLALTSIGCLVLVGTNRMQRSKVKSLQRQLQQSAASKPAGAQVLAMSGSSGTSKAASRS